MLFRSQEICDIISGPVSAEVTGLTAPEMIAEARDIAKWADNVVVKISMTTEGLKVVSILSKEGIKTNVTLIFTVSQGLMAMKAGSGTRRLLRAPGSGIRYPSAGQKRRISGTLRILLPKMQVPGCGI